MKILLSEALILVTNLLFPLDFFPSGIFFFFAFSSALDFRHFCRHRLRRRLFFIFFIISISNISAQTFYIKHFFSVNNSILFITFSVRMQLQDDFRENCGLKSIIKNVPKIRLMWTNTKHVMQDRRREWNFQLTLAMEWRVEIAKQKKTQREWEWKVKWNGWQCFKMLLVVCSTLIWCCRNASVSSTSTYCVKIAMEIMRRSK